MKKMPGDIITLHMCTKNHDHMMYSSWDMEYNTELFCHFGPFFDLLSPNKAENQSFEKRKNNPGDIYYYFTHVYHRCQSFDVWFFRYEAQRTEFLVILGDYLPILPLTQKIKILKKWKKIPGYIIILQKCTKNHDHMLYCPWDTTCDRCNFYFSFWAIFCPFNH